MLLLQLQLVTCLLWVFGSFGEAKNLNNIVSAEAADLPPPATSSNECGGVITGRHGYIKYKLYEKPNKNEVCIWTIRANIFPTISIQLINDNFEEVFDRLAISSINDLENETIVRTMGQFTTGNRTKILVNGPVLFVTFVSGQWQESYHRGFILYFQGIPFNSNERNINGLKPSSTDFLSSSQFQHFYYNSDEGEIKYPFEVENNNNKIRKNEIVTIVINPIHAFYHLTELQIESVDIKPSENCKDQVFSIHQLHNSTNGPHQYGNVTFLDRICQQDLNYLTNYYTIKAGFILVLRKNKNMAQVADSGFQARWTVLCKDFWCVG